MKQLALVLSVLVVAACGGKKAAPAAPGGAGAGEVAPAGPVVTLKGLENGDRACYVVFDGPDGEQSQEGSFDLCAGGAQDATALIGKRITFTTEKANVLAAECQGDVDCGKSDQVDLINTITAAP